MLTKIIERKYRKLIWLINNKAKWKYVIDIDRFVHLPIVLNYIVHHLGIEWSSIEWNRKTEKMFIFYLKLGILIKKSWSTFEFQHPSIVQNVQCTAMCFTNSKFPIKLFWCDRIVKSTNNKPFVFNLEAVLSQIFNRGSEVHLPLHPRN